MTDNSAGWTNRLPKATLDAGTSGRGRDRASGARTGRHVPGRRSRHAHGRSRRGQDHVRPLADPLHAGRRQPWRCRARPSRSCRAMTVRASHRSRRPLSHRGAGRAGRAGLGGSGRGFPRARRMAGAGRIPRDGRAPRHRAASRSRIGANYRARGADGLWRMGAEGRARRRDPPAARQRRLGRCRSGNICSATPRPAPMSG